MNFDIQRSDALHARVQGFIHAASGGSAPPESFDALACDIARHQAACGTGLERLLASAGRAPESLQLAAEIPAIPTDAFKFRRIACHPPELDGRVFRTSGTTIGARG